MKVIRRILTSPVFRKIQPFFSWMLLALVILLVMMSAWSFLRGETSVTKITTDDLVKEYIGTTVYERPKQWPAVGTGSASAFGEKGSTGKTTALVSASLGAYIETAVDADDALLDNLREQLLAELSEATISSDTNNSPCATVDEFAKEIDTTRNETSAGIVRAEALCSKQGVRYRLKLRVLLGRDGYTRTVLVVATDDMWKVSQSAFDRMLESLRQVETSEPSDGASQPRKT